MTVEYNISVSCNETRCTSYCCTRYDSEYCQLIGVTIKTTNARTVDGSPLFRCLDYERR